MIKNKKCTKCYEVKSVDLFGKDKYSGDKLTCQCKGCKAEVSRSYRANNKLTSSMNDKRCRDKEVERVIYSIKTSQGVYVGSTKAGLRRRIGQHTSNLNLNKHTNPLLQSIYNSYGLESFEFNVLERVSNDLNLITREQYWIDTYFANSLNINKAN